MTILARTYRRISVPRAARSAARATAAVSLDTQIEEIERYAAAHGMVIVGRYEDEMTGKRADRPGYQRLLADLERGEVVLIWKVDRIGRNKLESFRLYEEIERRGVRLVSVTEPDMSEELRDILTIAASWESKRNSERVRANMAHMTARGDHLARPPRWYVRDGRRLAPALGSEAAQELWEHALASGSVVETAVAFGIPNDTIYKMFRNPTYCGDTRWGDALVRDTHPAIVRRETWEAVRDLLAKRAEAHVRRHSAAPLLPPGILHVAGTDHRMYYHRKADERNNLYTTRRTGLIPFRSVRADTVESWLVAQLCAQGIDDAYAGRTRARVRAAQMDDPQLRARERIEGELTKLAAAKVRIGRTHGEGRMDDATYDSLRADLARDAAALEREMAALGAPPDPRGVERAIALRLNLAAAVAAAWEDANIPALRPLVEALVARVDAHLPDRVGVMGRPATPRPASFVITWNREYFVV